MYKRAFSLCGAMFVIALMHNALREEQVEVLWRLFVFEPDRHLGLGELRHYALLLVLGVPAALLLLGWLSAPAAARLSGWAARGGCRVPALVAGLSAFCISRYVTQGAWFTDDEQAYLFQMEGYSRLQMTVPALQPESMFRHPFVVVSRVEDGIARWSGTYPPMQPMLMALSRLLGSPLVSQWLCAALIAYHTGRLAEQLTRERALGVLAAWLCAASPGLIGLAATYHTAVPSCLFSLLAIRGLLAARARMTFARGALVGLAAGASFVTRGLEGTVMVMACGATLGFWLLKLPRAWPVLAGFCATSLLAAGVYAGSNQVITGDWERSAYAVWAELNGKIMGFGQPMMWGRTHTPELGLSQTTTTLIRMNTWLFGSPLSLILPLLSLLKPFRGKAVVPLWSLSGMQLFGYVFLPFGSVHDFGSAYHVWHVPWIAASSMILVKNARGYFRGLGSLFVALSCVGLTCFWPIQIAKWRTSAELVLAPVRAAEAAAAGREALVLWSQIKPLGAQSWVHFPPAPWPDNRIIWVRDGITEGSIAQSVLPGRVLLRMSFRGETPIVEPVP